jgi:hypothetical protein
LSTGTLFLYGWTVDASPPSTCDFNPNDVGKRSFLKERGRSSPRTGEVVTVFPGFPGRCGQAPARGRGQGSTVGRPEGLGLDAGSGWRRLLCAGNPGCGVACSPASGVDGSARRMVRSLFIPSPPAVGGMEWYAAARRGQSDDVDRATAVGVRMLTTSRPGCAGLVLTRVGPGNGCARHVAPSRPA